MKELSDDELRGRAKQFAEIVKQRPEFVLLALNDYLEDCDVGCNPYYKQILIGERKCPLQIPKSLMRS